MKPLLSTALLFRQCGAFLPPAARSFISPSSAAAAAVEINSVIGTTTTTRLNGIHEWRDQALELKYNTLDSYDEKRSSSSSAGNNASSSSSSPTTTPPPPVAILPVLPFPFSDVLLPGQRTQLNLYERRFHDLFQDAMDNHCGMMGMGLLAGNGMITTLPLCEVESFTRFGADENWIDDGNGMGNGSIFVTIRAVGRAKIVESDGLLEEGPYMKARVVELVDDDVSLEGGGGSGLKERRGKLLNGESSPLEVASHVAGNIENLMVSLASMEHKFKKVAEEEEKEKNEDEEGKKFVINSSSGEFSEIEGGGREANVKDGEDGIMNRRIVNAKLESLFMQDSNEGGVDVDITEADDDETTDDNDEEDEEENKSSEDDDETDENNIDRVAQFYQAFESAKEADTFGYISQPTTHDAPDNLSKQTSDSNKGTIRNSKDLAAISWASFCTGEKNNLQRDVIKIQALDTTNVLQRLQLAAAMLREEKKKWKAKLALAGITDSGNTDERPLG